MQSDLCGTVNGSELSASSLAFMMGYYVLYDCLGLVGCLSLAEGQAPCMNYICQRMGSQSLLCLCSTPEEHVLYAE